MHLRVLSLGAGVQSTTVFLLAADGKIEPFDAAVFADTQEESRAVYAHLWWLVQQGKCPTYIMSLGKLGDDLIYGRGSTRRFASIPAFTRADFAAAEKGRVPRQCTKDYKTNIVERTIRREVLGLEPGQRIPADVTVFQSVGISRDEARRAVSVKQRVEQNPRCKAVFPLLDLGWTRADCLKYLADRVPHEVPRSACVFCPFKSDAEWQRLKDNDAVGWERALEIDRRLRSHGTVASRGLERLLYLHSACKPLDQVEFQNGTGWLSFGAECEGMCGV